ncbi:uncharacterized protein GGS25DRAFT_531788 [Hypoxylon fragiforme]|uniref:uncharacterized protein n=1 Tax=Hypoxylon fragiforme TaxID=63214 RepID=UPI0020C6B421|nr:uncharacterized protein GGS25DRAFT_531788 [Hypoxylon fragiforme]KAI2608783.1 hypothetical protein GGS25DRAFT_531788 [Hypoxylon fragiforme]
MLVDTLRRDTATSIFGHRVDGIVVVSNHAGRQVDDGAAASLDAPERIVQAIMYDSGIRSGGADIFKALALSFIGPPAARKASATCWGGLLADFDILMNVAGYPDLKDSNRDAAGFVAEGGRAFLRRGWLEGFGG